MGYPGTCAVRKNLCYEAPNWANNSCSGSGKPANVSEEREFLKETSIAYMLVFQSALRFVRDFDSK